MPARTKITFQTELIVREILEDGDRALTLIRDEIIEDCNQYVPIQGSEKHNGGGGSLQNSAFIHSDQEAQDGELVIRWDTPYAQYQHGGLVMHGTPNNRIYGPQHLKYTSAAAKEEWAKYAIEHHNEQWTEMLEKAWVGNNGTN